MTDGGDIIDIQSNNLPVTDGGEIIMSRGCACAHVCTSVGGVGYVPLKTNHCRVPRQQSLRLFISFITKGSRETVFYWSTTSWCLSLQDNNLAPALTYSLCSINNCTSVLCNYVHVYKCHVHVHVVVYLYFMA